MGMFKRAAARGIATELARTGVVSFPTKIAMDEIADFAADSLPGIPETPVAGPEAPMEDPHTAALIQQIIALTEQLNAQTGGGAGGAPPPGAEMVQKEASDTSLEKLAYDAATSCMEKAAAETGTLAGQGDTNTLEDSAKTDAVGALEKKNRPEGAHHTGPGNTELDTSAGEQGASRASTVAPNASPAGENSVTEGTKSASEIRALLRKQAQALIGVGETPPNNLAEAAKTDAVAALELKNRPAGAYEVGQGNANFSESEAARVGKETSVAPSSTPAGTNSVIDASKVAAEDEEEQRAFLYLFNKTAADVASFLPEALSDDEKVAAVSAMVGLGTEGRQAYLTALHEKSAASKPVVPAAAKVGTSVLAGVRAALTK